MTRRTVLLCLPVWIVASASLRGAEAPRAQDDVASRFAHELAALSRGEGDVEDLIERFDAEFVARAGAAGLVRFVSDVGTRHAGSEVAAVFATADGGADVWLRCGTHEEHVVAELGLSDAGIVALSLRRASAFALPDGMRAAMSPADIASVLAPWLSDLADDGQFSGSVLLLEDDTVHLRTAYGLANATHAVPCKPETRYSIGSINKCFTALIIAQLVRDGRMELDANISRYPRTSKTRRGAEPRCGGS